jgi:hypothetical protein
MIEELFKLFFGQIEKQQIQIDTSNDTAWQAKYKAVSLPINKIVVDTDLKSALNQIAAQKEKSEGSYGGMTFKNENDTSITLNSDINFKKKGEEWVPTTLNAYVVNVLDVERNINIKYRQIVLGASSNIAVSLPMLSSRPIPAAPKEVPEEDRLGDPAVLKLIADRVAQFYADPNNAKALQARKHSKYTDALPNQRTIGQTYKNTMPYPISVSVAASGPLGCSLRVFIDDQITAISHHAFSFCLENFDVPPGSTYRVAVAFPNVRPKLGGN